MTAVSPRKALATGGCPCKKDRDSKGKYKCGGMVEAPSKKKAKK